MNQCSCNWPMITSEWGRGRGRGREEEIRRRRRKKVSFYFQRTINCYDLQELLEACLPNDYIKSCASLDVCRQVVCLMDVSGFGIGF